MNKFKDKSQAVQSRFNIIVLIISVVALLTSAYAVWNVYEIAPDTTRTFQDINSLNTGRVKHEKVILELQDCYNQKADTCTIKEEDMRLSD